MENYSLFMGATAVMMKMYVRWQRCRWRSLPGALPRRRRAGTETPVPHDLGFAMTAARNFSRIVASSVARPSNRQDVGQKICGTTRGARDPLSGPGSFPALRVYQSPSGVLEGNTFSHAWWDDEGRSLEEVKKKQKMLDAGFIRPCRYAEWISNVVPVEKKDGRWRVAIDFRNLNSATPKDEYPMPVAETLINAAAGHKVLSFMDGNAGYNQIFMAPEDIHKTAFRVPGSVGLFEYVVMTFGLKNAGATYQRAMNYIFHDLIGKLVEIYIDDVVVKSVATDGHLEDLQRVLDRTLD
ncbi:hypothetical protein QYE76_042680 [Lolium multiflorum]|uniref:Reverse transcriptase domain-containing protein n=1 Tax=Lolium multiflorum TaxID=4521 RepID=A0AAD8THK0_LOLMU|nr:hypothetical protein QYE76_042680 [Lolium multiflorum]